MGLILYRLCGRAVGRESKANPAFSIIPSPDVEHHHLPPTQSYKCMTLKKKVLPGAKERIYCE
jgi:hypothetical protein